MKVPIEKVYQVFTVGGPTGVAHESLAALCNVRVRPQSSVFGMGQ